MCRSGGGVLYASSATWSDVCNVTYIIVVVGNEGFTGY